MREYEDTIYCPYCGGIYTDDPWEYNQSNIDSELHCDQCEKDFILSDVQYDVTYSTTKKPCSDDKHEWGLSHEYLRYQDYKENLLTEKEWLWIKSYNCKNCDESKYDRLKPTKEQIEAHNTK